MCNQKDCQHENQQIIISDRDIKVSKAFMATMFMRIIMVLKNNDDVADWIVHAGTCAIDCNSEKCGTDQAMLSALKQAINHVDNGADLDIVASYNKAGLLIDGKAPSMTDKLTQILKSAGVDLDQFPDADGTEGAIDTIVVDPIPAFIDVSAETKSGPAEIGRLVGADRGRTPSILVGGPKRPADQLH